MTVRASGSAPDCHRATLTTTPSGRRGRRRPPDRLHAVDDAVLRRTRSLAAALEPVIGQVYFAPECHAAYARLGFSPSPGHAGPVALPDGPAYFTSRGSLLGQVRPGRDRRRVRRVQARAGRGGRADGLVAHRRAHDLRLPPRRRGRAAPTGARSRRRAGRARLGRARAGGRGARRGRSSAVRRAPVVVGRSRRPVDAAVPPRRHAPRVPWRRAHRGVDERSTRRRRDRAAQRPLHGAPGPQLRAHARLERRGARGGRRATARARLARTATRSPTTGGTGAKRSNVPPTARWRPRSPRSATTSAWSSTRSSRGAPRCARPAATWAARSTSGRIATTPEDVPMKAVSFACRGHPNVTATHDKTLELTRDPEISRRGDVRDRRRRRP